MPPPAESTESSGSPPPEDPLDFLPRLKMGRITVGRDPSENVPAESPTGGSRPGVEGVAPPNPVELHLALIEQFAPASVVVNRDFKIVHLSRRAGKYLRFRGGPPSVDLLNLVHPQLKSELRGALLRSSRFSESTRLPAIPVDLGAHREVVNVRVEPMAAPATNFLLVVSDGGQTADPLPPGAGETHGESPTTQLVQTLEREIEQLRATWRETTEQYELSTEELTASNEELLAMNEELRSAKEELDASHEDLRSVNEETAAINRDLKAKVVELGRTNADMQNLMESTRIATVFLDEGLNIQRFTPATAEFFDFIPSDVGRPLSDLTSRLEYPSIIGDAAEVVASLQVMEREVCTTGGHWFMVRLSPYRTLEDRIAGVVITFVDITERKKEEEAHRWLSAIVEASDDAIISFNMDGEVLSWNRGAEQIFGYSAAEMEGRSVALLAPPELQEEKHAIIEILRRGENLSPFETRRLRKDGCLIDISLSASVMKNESGRIVAATAIARDISERKRAQKELEEARELRERASQIARIASEVTLAEQRERKRMSLVLHDDLQQLLVSAQIRVEGLQGVGEKERPAAFESISRVMEEVIDLSRSLAVDLSPPALAEGLGPALEWLAKTWMKDKYGLVVHCGIDRSLDTGREDLRSLIFFAVRELLFNVVKHSQKAEAHLDLIALDGDVLQVTVRDHGVGLYEDVRGTGKPSSGLGLASLHERLGILGASLQVNSWPCEGVEAIITAPLARTE